MFGSKVLDYTFDGNESILINLIHAIAVLNCIMEQLSGSTLIFFALLKMDIAHLVSHALAGLTQLSIHCRTCDQKVIRTF